MYDGDKDYGVGFGMTVMSYDEDDDTFAVRLFVFSGMCFKAISGGVGESYLGVLALWSCRCVLCLVLWQAILINFTHDISENKNLGMRTVCRIEELH